MAEYESLQDQIPAARFLARLPENYTVGRVTIPEADYPLLNQEGRNFLEAMRTGVPKAVLTEASFDPLRSGEIKALDSDGGPVIYMPNRRVKGFSAPGVQCVTSAVVFAETKSKGNYLEGRVITLSGSIYQLE